jgi:Na+-transporting NADH:ubiquinone oxidoreductase subunit C
MAEESLARPFYTVLILALACSALVAGAAVGLRPLQEANRQIDQQKNILRAAGLYQGDEEVQEQFLTIRTRVVDLASGEFVSEDRISQRPMINVEPPWTATWVRLSAGTTDLAGLSRVERYSLVYLVEKTTALTRSSCPSEAKASGRPCMPMWPWMQI